MYDAYIYIWFGRDYVSVCEHALAFLFCWVALLITLHSPHINKCVCVCAYI